MIPVSRALPADGMEVVARGEDDSIIRTIYDNGFPMDGVKSWVWLPKAVCACHVLRWNKKSKKRGVCPSCGTRWKKVLDV